MHTGRTMQTQIQMLVLALILLDGWVMKNANAWGLEIKIRHIATHIILTCKMPRDTPNGITGQWNV